MRPTIILSLAVLVTISGTNVVYSETIQPDGIEQRVLQIYHRKYEGQRRRPLISNIFRTASS